MNDSSYTIATYDCFCEWKHTPSTQNVTDHTGRLSPILIHRISVQVLAAAVLVSGGGGSIRLPHRNNEIRHTWTDAVGQDHLANYRSDAVTAVKAIAILSFFGLDSLEVYCTTRVKPIWERDYWTGWWTTVRGTHSRNSTHTLCAERYGVRWLLGAPPSWKLVPTDRTWCATTVTTARR